VKVLLALADGTPAMYEVPIGKGKLIVATGPIGKNGLRQWAMREVEQRVTPLVRKVRDDGFHVLPRMDIHGRLYLGVFNKNVRERITDTLYVDGSYEQVVEKTLLGDWPVPTRMEHRRAAIDLTLAPGEATVLSLGTPLPPIRRMRDLEHGAIPEEPLLAWSADEFARVKGQIPGKRLEPSARAEAEALLLGAERQASMGYSDRARQLLDRASHISKPASFFTPKESVATAHRTKAPITIDGLASEWRNVPRYAVRGIGDEGGEFALQWDDKHLYVLVVSRDNDLRKEEEKGSDVNWIWNYDGLNLVLNTANTAPPTTGGALYDSKFRPTQTVLQVSITGRKYADNTGVFSAAAVRSTVKEIPGGYVMEVAIPLRDVMLPPIAGANVGMELRIINDGRQMGFGEFSSREYWAVDPLHFARLKLVE
jgi:hypothetical protein